VHYELFVYHVLLLNLSYIKCYGTRVCCESIVARVTGGILGNVYSYKTPTVTAYEGGTAFLGHYYASPGDLYWSALDHATAEYLWMGLQVGWTRSQVEIKYPKGNKPISYGDIIELPDRNTWNWGRPEVLHEYAHCIMYELYHGFPPGSCADSCQCSQGNHYYNSVADKGFAFTEGWAQFMQCAVDNNPANAYLHNLGDVDGNGVTNSLATNIEDNTYTVFVNSREYKYKWYHGRCFPACHNGNRVEGAVAGIFWDIYDPANDDGLSSGFFPIWNVLSTYRPQDMVEFKDRWMYYAVEPQLCAVYRDHGINEFSDLDMHFYSHTFFVAGDQAYCTDVLGSAKTAFGLAKGGVYENPEGRTETLLTGTKKDTGNLILVGGPAVSPLADEFDHVFGITYTYNPGRNFTIFCERKSLYLDLTQYPRQDICVVFLGEDNSRSALLVWGYGWRGTYAGCALMGDPTIWQSSPTSYVLMVRWMDYNQDGLVQRNEILVEQAVSTREVQELPEQEQEVENETPPETDSFGTLGWLFYSNTFFVAGDTAYCTDVLGSARIAFGLAKGGSYENPEGRTDQILKPAEHTTGNLIMVGGPAVSPLADEFDRVFGITYTYNPGRNFTIFCEGRSIYLDLAQYPHQDICLVYLGVHNGRNIMLVWGYGWEGTYAGSVLMGDPLTWQSYYGNHLIMLRWIDYDYDGLVQKNEISIEQLA
jgi:hypothetical protein